MTDLSMTRAEPVICLPSRWRSRAGEFDVLLVAEPTRSPDSGVRPRLVLHVAPVDADRDGWRHRVLLRLAERATDTEVDIEDEDDLDVAGREVVYARFGHGGDQAHLISDAWAWWVDGVETTVTATVARVDYAEYCDVFEAVAETVEPGGVSAG